MTFLGKNIRFLRKSIAKTQTELADMIGKGQTTIGNWENGISEPSLEELVMLGQYFKTSIDKLLTVDIAQTTATTTAPQTNQKKTYSNDQPFTLSAVGEEKLEYLINEVKKMREEIDQIKKSS